MTLQGHGQISSPKKERLPVEETEDSGGFGNRQQPQRARQKGILWSRGVWRMDPPCPFRGCTGLCGTQVWAMGRMYLQNMTMSYPSSMLNQATMISCVT